MAAGLYLSLKNTIEEAPSFARRQDRQKGREDRLVKSVEGKIYIALYIYTYIFLKLT